MTQTVAAADGVVAIGASAGGIQALTELSATLPPDLPFAVMVAVHMGVGAPSMLAQILNRSGPLPAEAGTDVVLQAGRIYVSVPGHHLLARDHRAVLSDGPGESGLRPAIDALFRSVAVDYGPHAIGVLLSGLLDDGVAGLEAIRAKGGATVVQEPMDALFPDLPRNALEAGVADYAAAAKDIGGLLMQLADRSVEEQGMDPDGRLELENQIAMGRRFAISVDAQELGPPTGYTCPTCKSVLMEVGQNTYRCRVGHAWTTRALLLARDHELEEAVWAAIRILKEKVELYRMLAESSDPGDDVQRYRASAEQAEDAIAVLGGSLFARQARAD